MQNGRLQRDRSGLASGTAYTHSTADHKRHCTGRTGANRAQGAMSATGLAALVLLSGLLLFGEAKHHTRGVLAQSHAAGAVPGVAVGPRSTRQDCGWSPPSLPLQTRPRRTALQPSSKKGMQRLGGRSTRRPCGYIRRPWVRCKGKAHCWSPRRQDPVRQACDPHPCRRGLQHAGGLHEARSGVH